MHVHVGLEHFIITAAEVTIFMTLMRLAAHWAVHHGRENLAAAIAFVF